MSDFLPPSRRNLVYGIKTGLQEDCRLVFLDLEAIDIIRRMLATRGLYRATYYAEKLENGYLKLTAAQFNIVEEIVSRALYQLGDDQMTCGTEIITALEGIQTSIENSASTGGGCGENNCSDGSGGAGGTETEVETFIDDGSTTFPQYYPDRASYTDKKCGIARGIIDQMLADLLWIETSNLTNLAVSVLVTTLFTPIPGDEIVALLGMVVTLFLQDQLTIAIQAIRTAINSQIETLICILMDATDSSDAQAEFLVELALSGVEAILAATFTTNDSFNRLFDYGDTPGGFAPCSCADECGCGTESTIGISSDGIRFVAEDQGYAWGVSIHVNTLGGTDTCDDTCGAEAAFVIDSLVGHSPTSATQDYQVLSFPADCTVGVSVHSSNAPWPDSLSGRVFQIWSATAFVVWRQCS